MQFHINLMSVALSAVKRGFTWIKKDGKKAYVHLETDLMHIYLTNRKDHHFIVYSFLL